MLHSTMLLIARTDSESASLISSTVDVSDQEFILGTTTPGCGLADEISEAETKGVSASELETIERQWMKTHSLCTFNDGTF